MPPPYYPSGTARPRAGSALTSLVLGIAGLLSSLVAGLLAVIFGIATLIRVRRTGERGAVMAITGIMLGIMWTAATIAFIALGVYAASHGSVSSLPAGACFDGLRPGQATSQVHSVPCGQPHNGQVVGTFTLAGRAWPGQAAVGRLAASGCAAMLGSVLHQPGPASGIRSLSYSPSQRAWSSGSRTVTCVLADPNAQRTGSLLNAGSGSG